jgi:adenylate kinase
LRIILLGAPGAGKGTQAAVISQKLAMPHIATGDLFRAALGQGTDLGNKAKAYMDKGELVPDDVTVAMVLERISEEDAKSGYILDGFPRTVNQGTALDQALEVNQQSIDLAILVDVSDEELVRRLSGRSICRTCQTPYHSVNNPPKEAGVCDLDGGELYQRDDDKAETVGNRLQVYSNETAPLINFFESQGKLVRINGEQDISVVEKQLLDVIDAK